MYIHFQRNLLPEERAHDMLIFVVWICLMALFSAFGVIVWCLSLAVRTTVRMESAPISARLQYQFLERQMKPNIKKKSMSIC
uniref:Uncharacterized protein n=1 Tax=Steinernema glaseri TaxID=37863 RepID=A0A1I7YKZ5_9BILA